MARKRKTGRIYWKTPQGRVRKDSRRDGDRAFVDLRDYSDVIDTRPGHHDKYSLRMALKMEDTGRSITNSDDATVRVAAILEDLDKRREDRRNGIKGKGTVSLGVYATTHLEKKAREPKGDGEPPVSDAWLIQAEKHLSAATDFFGASRSLASIDNEDLQRWVEHLRATDNGRGGTLSDASVRKYLNSLSNLFKRAVSEKRTTGVQSNPVADMFSKPTGTTEEAPFLEAHEAALLLESARTYRAATEPRVQGHGGAIVADAYPFMYPLLATFLLTGMRKSEVLGLEVDDVSLRHDKIYLRPNGWRGLKTKGSKRTVPLWPQLKEILSEYLMERERTGGLGSLLFPSGRGGEEKMITDLRKALAKIGERAGFPEGYIKLHMLRHTYTAARMQTCDRGRPIAMYTVARELGHRSTEMIEDRYGHLHDRVKDGDPEVVEFRVENHKEALKGKLEALR